jgi:hypothetical protein
MRKDDRTEKGTEEARTIDMKGNQSRKKERGKRKEKVYN